MSRKNNLKTVNVVDVFMLQQEIERLINENDRHTNQSHYYIILQSDEICCAAALNLAEQCPNKRQFP